MKSRQAGYSLAEMITVVAIVAMMTLVTVPSFISFRNSGKMRASVNTFTSDLRGARQRSITRSRQVMVTYEPTAAGAAPVNYKRTYSFYEGNLPFNSTTWAPITLTPGGGATTQRKLDDVIYFPSTGASTPQTFDDTLACVSSACTSGTDGRPEVIFFPDGRVRVPSGQTIGQITLLTDMKIAKKKYIIQLSPSGNVKAVAP